MAQAIIAKGVDNNCEFIVVHVDTICRVIFLYVLHFQTIFLKLAVLLYQNLVCKVTITWSAKIGDLNLSSIICRERNIIPKTEKGMLLETHAIHMGISKISYFRNTAQKPSSRKHKPLVLLYFSS